MMVTVSSIKKKIAVDSPINKLLVPIIIILFLHNSFQPTAEIRVKITPGRQVIVPHYYQPTSPGFDVDVQVDTGDRTHSGRKWL